MFQAEIRDASILQLGTLREKVLAESDKFVMNLEPRLMKWQSKVGMVGMVCGV